MSIEKEVLREQASQLHGSIPVAMLASMGGALCVAIFGWRSGAVPREYIVLWLGFMVAHSSLKLAAWRIFRKKGIDSESAPQWLSWSVLDAGMVSVLWGLVSLAFMASGQQSLMYVMLVAISMVSVGGMYTYGSHFRSFVAFLLPYTVLTVCALLVHFTFENLVLAFGSCILFVLILLAGNWTNRNLLDSLRLRFESLELVDELRKQKQIADAAGLSKTRLLAAASHDLRQPLYALNLYLGSLAATDMPLASLQLVSRARQCGQALDEMFTSLLDLSRLDASTVIPVPSAFPVSELMERIRIEFEPLAREKGLSFRVVGSSADVYSDVEMVERIVRNLVSNALKYTRKGKVLVGCRRKGDFLRLEVRDTGIGIPDDKKDVIFEEFVELRQPEAGRSPGMGLGLTIVSRLARLLDIPLTLESNAGGSMFAIDLPRSGKANSGGGALKGKAVFLFDSGLERFEPSGGEDELRPAPCVENPEQG